MNAKRILPLLAVALFPACTGYYKGKPLMTGEEVGVLSAGIAQMQFSDLPIPASFKLQTRDLESFGTQVGTFRLGHLVYHGQLSSTEAADYLAARLPEHGWKQISVAGGENGAKNMVFQKGPQTTNVSISRLAEASGNRENYPGQSTFFTKLQIDVKTGTGPEKSNNP